MPTDKQEIELKFELTGGHAEDILARPDVAGRVVSRRLVSTYFDSAEQALLHAGYSLRVRHEDGRWVQTLKSRRAGDGAVRDEWTLPVRRGAPEVNLLPCPAAVAALAGAAVEAIFVVEVERRSAVLDAPGCQVEICLDEGAVRCAGRTARVGDVELELKSGRRRAFFAFARDFRDRHRLRPTFQSKAERGFALYVDAVDGPRRYEAPAITRAMSAGDAFRAAARSALTQVAANAEALRAASATPDAEVVHQLRVGLRRLRSLMRIFRPVATDSRTASIRADLRRIANIMAPAREADVLLAGAYAEAAWEEDGQGARRAFGRRLRLARNMAYARARAAVQDDGFSMAVMATLLWIEAGPWTSGGAKGEGVRDAPVAAFAALALEKSCRRVLRKARRFDRLDPLERHALRISAKTLRYALDGLGPLFADHPKRRRRFIAALKAALEALGDLNDLAGEPPWGGAWPAPVIVWRDGRHAWAEAAAAKALRALADARTFWPRP